MGQNTTKGDGGANERVEFLIAADGELQVAGSDTLDLEVLGGVLQERELVSAQVFWGWVARLRPSCGDAGDGAKARG